MKNKSTLPPEKLLIDTYKHIDQARNKLEQFINHMGAQHSSIHQLPDDIHQLIEMTLKLPPEKRKILRLFLESLQSNQHHHDEIK